MLAERDDAGAQTEVGVQFEAGRGVERDYGEAVTRHRRAAEQGSPSRRAVLTLGWHAHHVQIPSEGGSSGARSPGGYDAVRILKRAVGRRTAGRAAAGGERARVRRSCRAGQGGVRAGGGRDGRTGGGVEPRARDDACRDRGPAAIAGRVLVNGKPPPLFRRRLARPSARKVGHLRKAPS